MNKFIVKNKQAYIQNEADANKHMSFVNAAAGVLSLIIWLLYLTRVFTIPDHFYLAVCLLFPAISVVMFIPLFFLKTDMLKKPGYKYFILFSLLAVIIASNIAVPKHSLLFWPFVILMANHYYNPRIGRVIYLVTLICMLLCLYLGMFFGEFDENLFGSGVIKEDGTIGTVETFEERWWLLHNLMLKGDNRYVKVLLYYFFPRALIITMFFIVSNLLNRRTYMLLDREIKAHDETERSKTELSVAKEIQLNTLPDGVVDSKDVEIIGELKAAKEVGGDLYDYLDIDNDHVAILVGDVSGKGVPAAMFMMKTITSFRDFAAPNKKPSEILKQVNTSILKGNKKNMFVTCFLAILDKRNGKVVFANAGHNPPIVGSHKNYRYLSCKHGFLLGCFDKCNIEDEEFILNRGESITLYTDGITEARNIEGDFFGEERLLHVFNKHDYICTVDLHHALKDEVAGFVKDAPQSDDITFITMKFQGNNYSYKENHYDAKKDNIQTMLDFIKEFGEERHFPEEFKNQLVVVGDELFSNIIKHGYENEGGDIFVRLLFDKDNNEFVLTVIDNAKAFNQLEVNNPEVGSDAKEQKIGGLGIMIVKKIMSEYTYDRINDKNILVLKKSFTKDE